MTYRPLILFIMLFASSKLILNAFKTSKSFKQNVFLTKSSLLTRFMATDLFVGNLPLSFDEGALKDLVKGKIGERYYLMLLY